MKKDKVVFISYSIELRTACDDSYRHYKLISPDEIEEAAQILGYKGKGLRKLISHTSQRYTFIKTDSLYIDKVFHSEPVQYQPFDSQWEKNSKAFLNFHKLL